MIHAPKRQSMKKSKMRCVYKRDSIMFYFDEEKEKASNILMDKVKFCNKSQLETINNRAEACYVCMKCGDCDVVFFFQQLIIEICQVGSKEISNNQELIQSDPISCPQNQKGNN